MSVFLFSHEKRPWQFLVGKGIFLANEDRIENLDKSLLK